MVFVPFLEATHELLIWAWFLVGSQRQADFQGKVKGNSPFRIRIPVCVETQF